MYDILGASPTESRDELKKKFKTLAKQSHPDALRSSSATKSVIDFQEVAAAWDILSNEETRRKYDQSIRQNVVTRPDEDAIDDESGNLYQEYKEWHQAASKQKPSKDIDFASVAAAAAEATNNQSYHRPPTSRTASAHPYTEHYHNTYQDPYYAQEVTASTAASSRPSPRPQSQSSSSVYQAPEIPAWMKAKKPTPKDDGKRVPSWMKRNHRVNPDNPINEKIKAPPRRQNPPQPSVSTTTTIPRSKYRNQNHYPKSSVRTQVTVSEELRPEDFENEFNPYRNGPPPFHPEQYVSAGPKTPFRRHPTWKNSSTSSGTTSEGAPSFHTERFAPTGHAPRRSETSPPWMKQPSSPYNSASFSTRFKSRTDSFSSVGIPPGGVPDFHTERYAPPGHSPLNQ